MNLATDRRSAQGKGLDQEFSCCTELSGGSQPAWSPGCLWGDATGTGGVALTTSTIPTSVASAPHVGKAPTGTIIIANNGSCAFSRARLTIKTGATGTCSTTTAVSDTVRSDDGKSCDSGTAHLIAAGGTFSFTMITAGIFAYLCANLPCRLATAIVQ
jgi:plastocyanin